MQSFKSVDCVVHGDEATNYPTEFLNSLELPGVPQHILLLKVGSVVIMLRNLRPPKLCNGTRLIVKQIMNNIIYATISKGKFEGKQFFIPRIPLMPTDMPFEFKRIHFPVRLACLVMNNIIYATIIKSRLKGIQVFIPRISLIPIDMPFEFKRIKFPVRLAFALQLTRLKTNHWMFVV